MQDGADFYKTHYPSSAYNTRLNSYSTRVVSLGTT